MPDFYGGPGIGRTAFPRAPVGSVVFSSRDTSSGSNLFSEEIVNVAGSGIKFLIQDWNLGLSERVQEVTTLAETEHIYTFGRNISKLSLRGYFVNSDAKCSDMSDLFDSKKILQEWSERLRAKKSGQQGEPLALVDIAPIDASLKCVVVSLNLTGTITQEALITADLQMLVLEDMGNLIT